MSVISRESHETLHHSHPQSWLHVASFVDYFREAGMTNIRTATGSLPTHCAPIDKNASREMWAPSQEIFPTFQMPTLWPVSVEEINRRLENPLRDLVGLRRGAVTVVGLIEYRENGRSVWCVRCDCGRYMKRTHRGWCKYLNRGRPDYCRYCCPHEQNGAA